MATDIFSNYRTFSSRSDAGELASLLMDPERERPAVVVSTTKAGPIIDPAALAKRLGDTADVYVLGNAGIAFDLEDQMPPDTSVYGGAARSYPPGTGWMRNAHKSMVRLAYGPEEGRAALALIAGDIADMEPAFLPVRRELPTSFISPAAPSAASARTVSGTVSVLLEPDGVLVKLEDGIARIDTSALASGIEPSRLFSAGQEVTGTLRDGVLAVTGAHTVADAVDHTVRNGVYPALVASEKAVILFPGLSVRHASDAPAGAVVAVRIVVAGRADGKAWKLAAVADPEAVEAALPFLPGGQPWITWETADEAEEAPCESPAPAEAMEAPAETEVESSAQAPADDVFTALDTVRVRFEHLHAENSRLQDELDALTAEPAPETGPLPTLMAGGAELERARVQIALLTRQRGDMIDDKRRAMIDADELAADNVRLTQHITKLREQVRTERARADRARRMTGDITEAAGSGVLFSDPGEQLRHEIYLEWATRIPAGSKADRPLAAYDFVNGFLDDVADIQGVDRSKIVAVAVEVLTGLADTMPGRDMHRLRGGNPGTSTFVDHPVYGTAWRVALQIKTASARRMHFWRGNDGMIRFATVGVHDDMGI